MRQSISSEPTLPELKERGYSAPLLVAALPVGDPVGHPNHVGCCLTPAFHKVTANAEVPVLVVDAEGTVIYANSETEALLHYSATGLAGEHITAIVDAAPNWVTSEFSFLAENRLWNGNVLMRRSTGDNLRIAVNAFRSVIPGESAEYIALLHHVGGEGPALQRLPDLRTHYALSASEVALLELLAEGFIEKEIAAILGSSVVFVSADIQKLMRKLDASSRTEACVRALREGLVA